MWCDVSPVIRSVIPCVWCIPWRPQVEGVNTCVCGGGGDASGGCDRVISGQVWRDAASLQAETAACPAHCGQAPPPELCICTRASCSQPAANTPNTLYTPYLPPKYTSHFCYSSLKQNSTAHLNTDAVTVKWEVVTIVLSGGLAVGRKPWTVSRHATLSSGQAPHM